MGVGPIHGGALWDGGEMKEYLSPVLHVRDARRAAAWYARLGFTVQWEHRFDPELPLYVSIARGRLNLHLSEHSGDAQPGALVYISVLDVDEAARSVGISTIEKMPWGRDFEVADPDGNRLRIGTPDS